MFTFDCGTGMLTTGVDTITGTDANDLITGTASSLTSTRTLDAGDQIDGGAGSDTLNVTMQSNFNGFTGDGFLKNVETVKLTNDGTISRAFSAKQVEGVEEYVLKGNLDLNNLASTDSKITIEDRSSGTTTIAYTSEAVEGTADAVAVSFKDVGAVETKTVAEKQLQVDVAGAEELNLTSTGTNFVKFGKNDTTSITADGAGSLKITAVSTALKTFDASTATGNIDVDTTAVATASQITSIATGTGDDTITIDALDLRANAEVNGGEGADTLFIKGGNATVQYAMAGVETLKLGALTGGKLTFSASNTEGLEKVIVTKDTAQDATLASLGAIDMTVELQGANANTKTLTLDNTAGTTITVDTPADTATKAAPSTNDYDVTLNKSTSVDMTVAEKMSYTGTVTASKAESINLAVKGEVTTGATIAAAAAAGVTITEVANNSILDLQATAATELNVTAAKDLDISATALAALETLTVDTDGDFKVGALAKISTATISGLGSAELGNLGSTTQDYAISVTASELAENATTSSVALEIGTINTLGANVSVNASEVMGEVKIGAINTLQGGTTAGNVTLEFNGTGDDIALVAITGNNVTIDATDALGTITYGGLITVGDTLVINGTELNANDLSVNGIAATGDTFTATLNGGIGADKFVITTADGNDTATIKVSGDLGLGANTVSIDASAETDKAVSIDVSSLVVGDDAAAGITIEGGALADTIKLGSSATIVTVLDVTAGGMDKITGFDADSHTIQFFNSTDYLNDTDVDYDTGNGTLALALAAVSAKAKAEDGNDSTAWAVAFKYDSKTYIYIDGANDGYAAEDDAVIEVTGISATELDAIGAANFA